MDELKVSVTATVTNVNLFSFYLSPSSFSFYLWHSHLGLVLSSCLKNLASIYALENLQTCDISDYKGCKLTKIFALLFNWRISIFSSPFDLIHSDV